jgi:N-acetyl sugar amidotransferase
MQVCTKGLWDETIPGIKFDENGVSNFCHLQERMMTDHPRGDVGAKEWNLIVSQIKSSGKNKKYDSIIGVSGGVDSSYLLHIAHQYGLKPLAVNLDNGFNSEIAVQNIYKLTSKLDIDLETYVIDYEEIKDLLRSYMKAGLPWIDAPTDLAIKATMYIIAMKEGIHYIIRGNDFRSEGKQPKEWTYSDAKQLKYIHKMFGSGIKLKTYPMLTLSRMIFAGLIKRIKDIRPLYYLEYNKPDAKQLMIELYDWKDYGGHHHENLFTKFSMAYWLPKKFNIDKRKINLSAQILNGAITKESAELQLAEPFDTEKELNLSREYVIKKLGISNIEFEQIWDSKNKKTFDYPSNYNLIFGLAKRFSPIISKFYAFKPMSITENEIISQ